MSPVREHFPRRILLSASPRNSPSNTVGKFWDHELSRIEAKAQEEQWQGIEWGL